MLYAKTTKLVIDQSPYVQNNQIYLQSGPLKSLCILVHTHTHVCAHMCGVDKSQGMGKKEVRLQVHMNPQCEFQEQTKARKKKVCVSLL